MQPPFVDSPPGYADEPRGFLGKCCWKERAGEKPVAAGSKSTNNSTSPPPLSLGGPARAAVVERVSGCLPWSDGHDVVFPSSPHPYTRVPLSGSDAVNDMYHSYTLVFGEAVEWSALREPLSHALSFFPFLAGRLVLPKGSGYADGAYVEFGGALAAEGGVTCSSTDEHVTPFSPSAVKSQTRAEVSGHLVLLGRVLRSFVNGKKLPVMEIHFTRDRAEDRSYLSLVWHHSVTDGGTLA
mmetsp:Transcript_71454/g.225661  ORF Transcript_71454/g.225661 Transcript_71454/m.225661 type:complete len:239 (-) Transcript_71454:1335-2051(-)